MQKSMSSSETKIVTATPDDLSSLTEINLLAFMRECTAQIAFPGWPEKGIMQKFIMSGLQDDLLNPHTQVFKAVQVSTHEILGFVCLELERSHENESKSEAPEPDASAKTIEEMAPSLNMPFVMAMEEASKSLKSHKAGTKHYCECSSCHFKEIPECLCATDLSSFAVPPKHQSKGIGSKLLQHCFNVADGSDLPIWVSSFPGSHGLYLRNGFSDVHHEDLDLNAWDGNRFRGYGIYRTYAMVRQPSVNKEQ